MRYLLISKWHQHEFQQNPNFQGARLKTRRELSIRQERQGHSQTLIFSLQGLSLQVSITTRCSLVVVRRSLLKLFAALCSLLSVCCSLYMYTVPSWFTTVEYAFFRKKKKTRILDFPFLFVFVCIRMGMPTSVNMSIYGPKYKGFFKEREEYRKLLNKFSKHEKKQMHVLKFGGI